MPGGYKVVKTATGQIRATMRLLNSGDPVLVANERGHVFDLATTPDNILLRVILFKSSDRLTPLPYPRFHRSRSAGLVHIFDALDYFGMCQYLATPIEVADS